MAFVFNSSAPDMYKNSMTMVPVIPKKQKKKKKKKSEEKFLLNVFNLVMQKYDGTGIRGRCPYV